MRKDLIYLTGALLFVSCKPSFEVVESNVSRTKEELDQYKTINLSYIDRSIKPQNDFFQFSNGNWIKNNPVPPSESRWGSFNELEKANNEKLTKILEEAKKKNEVIGSTDQILGSFYSAMLDFERRNIQGLSPIKDQLDAIEAIDSKKDFPVVIAEHHILGINSLFSFGVGQDLKDVDNHTIYFSQGGISLPNKDYYFNEDKADILDKFKKHIRTIGTIIGMDEKAASKWADQVVDFESKLATKMMAPAELRVPENTYNKFNKKELIRMTRYFDAEKYFASVGVPSFDTIIVGQPDFAQLISDMVENTEMSIWKSYLKWKVIDHFAGHLTSDLDKANFDFYGGVLSGKSEMKPMNERAIRAITGLPIGELLGKAFIERYFSEAAKDRVNEMVDNLLIVFEERIKNLTWMSAVTKDQALLKLSSIGRKLGYPDKWEDFSSLRFSKDDYIGNLNNMAKYSHYKNMGEFLKPVDKDEWGMPPHMVNAYYHPLLNEIAFPAGIMQAPFFSDSYEDAVNYGRIGMVIGHEFTHGFDDMGSKFAADGSFTNWWSVEDRALFEERTAKLGETFAGFCPIDGHCVNPDLTMGENIADLGGLTMAYYAYTRTDEFKKGEIINGFTPAQRFFIAYAQLWKIKYTDEELKKRIATDPHSPGMYRVNGPLMNCPEFFEAFDVKEGDPMRNSEDVISKIW